LGGIRHGIDKDTWMSYDLAVFGLREKLCGRSVFLTSFDGRTPPAGSGIGGAHPAGAPVVHQR
jgi:hypothetical protein